MTDASGAPADDRRLPEWTDHMLRNRLRAVQAAIERQGAALDIIVKAMTLLAEEAADIHAEIKRRDHP